MLLYIDHGACRGIFTKVEDYLKVLDEKPWALLSTLPYVVEEEEREKLSQKVIDYWLRITGSVRFVEDVYVMARWINIREMTVNELARKIVRLLSEVKHYLEDVFLMNIFLKIETGLALPDIGLLAIYENPLLVEQGVRQRPLPVARAVLRRAARALYESKLTRGLKELELEYVIVRNIGVDKPAIVDWTSLGMYPYSHQTQSIVNEQEVADPLLIANLVHRVRIRTVPDKRESVIQHYRDVREVVTSLRYYLARAREVLSKQIIVLPNTMTTLHVNTVMGFLRVLGIEVIDTVSVPVDLLLSAANTLSV